MLDTKLSFRRLLSTSKDFVQSMTQAPTHESFLSASGQTYNNNDGEHLLGQESSSMAVTTLYCIFTSIPIIGFGILLWMILLSNIEPMSETKSTTKATYIDFVFNCGDECSDNIPKEIVTQDCESSTSLEIVGRSISSITLDSSIFDKSELLSTSCRNKSSCGTHTVALCKHASSADLESIDSFAQQCNLHSTQYIRLQ
jgi:hypothetical protein